MGAEIKANILAGLVQDLFNESKEGADSIFRDFQEASTAPVLCICLVGCVRQIRRDLLNVSSACGASRKYKQRGQFKFRPCDQVTSEVTDEVLLATWRIGGVKAVKEIIKAQGKDRR